MITRRQAYRSPRLDIRSQLVLVKKSVKYVRVTLDNRLNFTRHVMKVARSAIKTTTADSRVMNNLSKT